MIRSAGFRRFWQWLRTPWVTFAVLLSALILPAISVVWLVGRAAENERAALQQAYISIQQREALLVRDQLTRSVHNLFESIDRGQPLVGWCMRKNERHPAWVAADDTSLDYLEDLRYLLQTFGPVAVLEQIRYWLQQDALSGLQLSEGRDLKSAVLLLGMQLQPESDADNSFFQLLVEDLLSLDSAWPEGSAQRVFIIASLLNSGPGSHSAGSGRTSDLLLQDKAAALLSLRDAEQAALRFTTFMNLDELAGVDPGRLVLQGSWVFRVNPAQPHSLWFLEEAAFKEWMLTELETTSRSSPVAGAQAMPEQDSVTTAGHAPEWNPGRFELLTPGSIVSGADPLELTLDLATPLEGWRLFSRLDEDSLAVPAQQRVWFYTWVGVLTTLVSVLFAGVGMSLVRHEMSLAKFKNDLAATVSHELKTPVASVRILVDTLLEQESSHPLDARTTEYLQMISRENQRLGLLVERFLTFSRMQRGTQAFDPEPVSADAIAVEACKIFRERFPGGDYELQLHLSNTSNQVYVDLQALLSGIGNLLENAYKYSRVPRHLQLSVMARSSDVAFEVVDNGEGIAPSEQKKIFQKFYQPNRRLNNHRGGVGLGLSIVAHVVHQHHGRIELESELKKGSLFRILLPYAKDTDH